MKLHIRWRLKHKIYKYFYYLHSWAHKLAYETPLGQTFGELQDREFLGNFSKEEIIEIVTNAAKTNYNLSNYIVARENDRLVNLLRSEYHTNKALNHAMHVADLELKVKRQAETIREMQEKAERFNKLLFATGYIVNCTGCEAGSPDKAEELTEEKVQYVEMLAKRLRTWWDNHQYRIKQNQETKPDQRV